MLPHLRNKKAGRGRRDEKEETKEEKVNTHSKHPSVDSTLLTSVRPLALQLVGPVTAVAEATEKKHQLCGLLSALP